MIITNSSIGMESARTYTSVSMDAYLHEKSVETISANDFFDSLKTAYKDLHKNPNEDIEEKRGEDDSADTLSSDEDSSLDYLKGKFNEITAAKISKTTKLEDDLRSAIRYLCLNFLLMLLFGKNGGADAFSKITGTDFSNDDSSFNQGNGFGLPGTSLRISKVTESVSIEHYEGEFEGTTFNAKGIVRTADGREIDFGIDLTMSRSFERYAKLSENYESFGMTLMDPLVINLDTCTADVTDQKFYFDLDSDGIEDEITTLSKNSGFLALDLNGDGEINNGSELFGTKSGDGFKDLSKYDGDGNGWIDEADEVFDKLKIFCINEDGTTSQYSLKDKGVGAIYLGNRETEFSIKNMQNNTNAMIRKTGLFLYENGSAGTMQHVDLSVELGA